MTKQKQSQQELSACFHGCVIIIDAIIIIIIIIIIVIIIINTIFTVANIIIGTWSVYLRSVPSV